MDSLIKLKAELLIHGARVDETLYEQYKKQNPREILKTGNNGLFVRIAKKHEVMICVSHKKNAESPYKLVYDEENNNSYIMNNGVQLVNVEIMEIPTFYNNEIGQKKFHEVFLFEGFSYFHIAYKGCDFFNRKLECKYCTTGKGQKNKSISSQEIGAAAATIDTEHNYHICIGGGTILPQDTNIKFGHRDYFKANMDYFVQAISEIRKYNATIPIWIECVPPYESDIDRLVEAGATSFGFNIEIWNPKRKSTICPGKSEIPREHYLKMLQYAVECVGNNKVGSSLIIHGTEFDEKKELLVAIKELSKIGVHTCLLPYKPFTETKIIGKCDVDLFYEVNEFAYECYQKYNLDPFQNEGCMLCSSCTILLDIFKSKQNQTYITKVA